MTFELPKFINSFNKQIKDLAAVENSLNRDAEKISKVRQVLEKRFNKDVILKLEKISDKVIVMEEERKENNDNVVI